MHLLLFTTCLKQHVVDLLSVHVLTWCLAFELTDFHFLLFHSRAVEVVDMAKTPCCRSADQLLKD